jgi:hypothetical protein
MRRPVRFFNHEISEDGQIWLDENMTILSARFVTQQQWPGRWHVVVVEYGEDQDLSVEHGRAQFKSARIDGREHVLGDCWCGDIHSEPLTWPPVLNDGSGGSDAT